MVHAKCVGLTACTRNIIQGKDDPVYCATHSEAVTKWNNRTAIELKHLVQGRADYVLAQQQKKEAGIDVGVFVHVKTVAFVAGMPLSQLNASIPVAQGGFAQRNVASHSVSTVEEAIKKNGWSTIFGTIAVVELPRSPAEVAELKAGGHLPADYSYPKKTFLQMLQTMPKENKAETWMIAATDPSYQMELRRFAIVDGNNRVMALVKLTSEFKGTATTFPQTLTCWLVDVEINDPLAVQIASMKCNALGHETIADSFFDTILQFHTILDAYAIATGKDWRSEFTLSLLFDHH